MQRLFRFLLPLVVVLGLLTWAAAVLVGNVSRRWFEEDAALRAELAVRGARRALLMDWNDKSAVRRVLDDITRGERVLGAVACKSDGTTVARTWGAPQDVECESTDARFRHPRIGPDGSRHEQIRLSSGDVFLSKVDLANDDGKNVGSIVLIHDLAVAQRREAATQRYYVIGFGILALLASLATVVITRLSWKSFREDLRNMVRGGPRRPEFAPLLSDVRDLVERLAAEHETDISRRWTAERLQNVLTRHVQGERVIIVANREPYVHEKKEDGTIVISHPASGLVTALEPVMRACSGVWIAHGSGSADRETADAHGRIWVPPGEEVYLTRRVWLSAEEEQGYYYGFSNEGLWPLCHVAHARPIFRGDDYLAYRTVNERFAKAVSDEADTDDPIVFVQDYHFALAPKFIREKLPRATIISFWHIPWPNAERLGICPQHVELVEGMLGSSIIGFHTQQHCNNFLEAVDRYFEARIDREQNAVLYQGRRTLVRAYPISIEWPSRWLINMPSVDECRRSVIEEHALPKDVILAVGVDRIDYTKGIEERLLAVERLLERRPDLIGKFTFIQLGAPSRTKITRYRDLNTEIERTADRINAKFPGREGWRPIIVHRAHHEPPTVFRYYRAANMCVVSSLHDGMNLVAKEFVAARDDERGVLVLSRFTGAARELTESLIVNPYDAEETSAALAAAVDMQPEEQRERMRAMRHFVAEWNIYRWAGRILVDAANLRQVDRLAGRLSSDSMRSSGYNVRIPPATRLSI